MKTRIAMPFRNDPQKGSALILTMIMSAIALAILASAMVWSSSSTRLTYRTIQYSCAVEGAEAATEKVVGNMSHDFLYGGARLVSGNLDAYRERTVPNSSDSSYWNNWEFTDAKGNKGQTSVELGSSGQYVVLDSTFSGLHGYLTTYNVTSHARDTSAYGGGSMNSVTAGVFQEVKLESIPIFQFAMYSSGDMEVSCGQPLDVTGRVHANGMLYVEPDNAMTFESDVTAVQDILFSRDPLDPRGVTPGGTVVYVHPDEEQSHVPAMTLPIGMTNSPEAVREIIQPPPDGEDPDSPLGQLRYYNKAQVIIEVSDTGITVKSEGTKMPAAEVQTFVSTNNNFWDAREQQTVLPVDVNVGAMKTWSETSPTLGKALGGVPLSSVYVYDHRNLPTGALNAVRVSNGKILPKNGLTVATSRPLYVQGDYNELDDTKLGTRDTSATLPASLVGDAITILSDGWTDKNSTATVGSRVAKDTTVNAAFLTGVVETTKDHYSGGMENFPRFLETWGPIKFTYNGSMVKMFPSQYATAPWNNNGDIYGPPTRKWAYDVNFEDVNKIPPITPSLQKVMRGKWSTVASAAAP